MSNQIELAMFKDYQGRLKEMLIEEGRDPAAFRTILYYSWCTAPVPCRHAVNFVASSLAISSSSRMFPLGRGHRERRRLGFAGEQRDSKSESVPKRVAPKSFPFKSAMRVISGRLKIDKRNFENRGDDHRIDTGEIRLHRRRTTDSIYEREL